MVKKINLFLLLICCITVNSKDCAILYSECDYKGQNIQVCNDNPSLNDFQTKSAKIPNGMVISIYDDSYFQGKNIELSSDTPCIENSQLKENDIQTLKSLVSNLADQNTKQQEQINQLLTQVSQFNEKSQKQTEQIDNQLQQINTLNKSQQQIQMGKEECLYWSTGHAFEIGTGSRSDTRKIKFPKPFKTIPKVQVSLCGYDLSVAGGIRLTMNVISVDSSGCEIKLNTWADTKMYLLHICWTAFDSN